MLLDSTYLFSDAIGDDKGVDTVTDGSSKGVAVLKDAPANDNDADDEGDDDDDWESDDFLATFILVIVIVVIDKMLLDSTLLSFDVISDDESVGTVGEGGNGGVPVFKNDSDSNNDADGVDEEEKGDDDDWESNDAAAIDVVVVVINGHGDELKYCLVDCSSGASVGECKIIWLKCT